MTRPKKILQCNHCKKIFTKNGELEKHLKQHAIPKSFQCAKCEAFFTTTAKLNAHINNEHVKTELIKCDMCGCSFKGEDKFKIHMETHLIHDLFKCETCHKSFRSLQGLGLHKRVHFKEYNCTMCTMSFSTTSALQKHQTKHSDCTEESLNIVETAMQKTAPVAGPTTKPKKHDDSAEMTAKRKCDRYLSIPLVPVDLVNVGNDIKTNVQKNKSKMNLVICPETSVNSTETSIANNLKKKKLDVSVNSRVTGRLYSKTNIQKNNSFKICFAEKPKARKNNVNRKEISIENNNLGIHIKNTYPDYKANLKKFPETSVHTNDSVTDMVYKGKKKADLAESVKDIHVAVSSDMNGNNGNYSRTGVLKKRESVVKREINDVEVYKKSDRGNMLGIVNSVKPIIQNHNKDIFWCRICARDFCTAEEFKEHIFQHHTNTESEESDCGHAKLLQNSFLNSSKYFKRNSKSDTQLKQFGPGMLKFSSQNLVQVQQPSLNDFSQTNRFHCPGSGVQGVHSIVKKSVGKNKQIFKPAIQRCIKDAFWCHLCICDFDSAEEFRNHMSNTHRNVNSHESDSSKNKPLQNCLNSKKYFRKNIGDNMQPLGLHNVSQPDQFQQPSNGFENMQAPLDVHWKPTSPVQTEEIIPNFDIESADYVLWVREFINKCRKQVHPYPQQKIQQILKLITDITKSLKENPELLDVCETFDSLYRLIRALDRLMINHVENTLFEAQNE